MKNSVVSMFLVALFATSSAALASTSHSPPPFTPADAVSMTAVNSKHLFIKPYPTMVLQTLSGGVQTGPKRNQRDDICIYLCNKDPSEGGTYCNCDQYPLY